MSDESEEREFREARAQVDRARIWFVPVHSVNSDEVHATTIASTPRTGCNKRLRRAVVATTPLTCIDCMIAVGLRVPWIKVRKPKPRKRRAKRRRR